MIIRKISLSDFRNYTRSTFTFSSGKNLIVGPNASGKTNLLEAIYLLATGKSFRVKGVESETVSYEKEMARVSGEIIKLSNYPIANYEKGDKESLEIVLTRGEVSGEKVAKKKYLINGVGKRATDFVGRLRAVYFGPEDLELVTNSPSLRRRYLDAVLVQIDREYARASLSYEKGLRARNKILEDIKEWQGNKSFSEETFRKRLYFWDQLLIRNGNIVTRKREEFLEFLNQNKRFGEIGGFAVEYDRSTISPERLAQYRKEEMASGMTLVGPHRDDFAIRVKELESERAGEYRNLSVFGSRGEQRLAILWMKLGELAFIMQKTNDQPVLLLDDIFSELDTEHRELVFGLIGEQQTIVTTADIGTVEKEWLEGVRLIQLD